MEKHMRRVAVGALFLTLLVTSSSAQGLKYKFPDYQKDPNPMVILGPAGEIFTFTKVGATTCGKFTIGDTVVPPTAGPPPHIHHWTDEWFYFPDGGITIYMSEKTVPRPEAGAGTRAAQGQGA
jgi:hypothetical protein